MSWSEFRDAKTRAEWRELLMLKQKGRCALCGHRFPLPADEFHSSIYEGYAPTFDHVVPKAHGGGDDLTNLRVVHRTCNYIRGDGDTMKRIPSMPRKLRLT